MDRARGCVRARAGGLSPPREVKGFVISMAVLVHPDSYMTGPQTAVHGEQRRERETFRLFFEGGELTNLESTSLSRVSSEA